MKKILIILIAIIGLPLFLSSCSEKEKNTKTLTNVFQNIDEILVTKTDTVKYIDIVDQKVYLWKLSELYLKDGMRHMELAMHNHLIFDLPERWHTNGPNSSWDYAYAQRGDRIFLPNDAYGPGIKSIYTEHTYVKEGVDLQDYYIGDISVIDDLPNTGDSHSGLSESLVTFWDYIGPIFGILLLILLFLLLLWLLKKLLASKNNDDKCTGVRSDLASLGRKIDDNHHLQMKTMKEISESKQSLEHPLVGIIKAANEGGGNQKGYSHLSFTDETNKLNVDYISEKNGIAYSRNELYLIADSILEDYDQDEIDQVVEVLYKNFQEEERDKIIKLLKAKKQDDAKNE